MAQGPEINNLPHDFEEKGGPRYIFDLVAGQNRHAAFVYKVKWEELRRCIQRFNDGTN